MNHADGFTPEQIGHNIWGTLLGLTRPERRRVVHTLGKLAKGEDARAAICLHCTHEGKQWIQREYGWHAALAAVRDLSGCYPGIQFQIEPEEPGQ